MQTSVGISRENKLGAVARSMRIFVGPAAVMAAASMGAGEVATMILAGAWFGYALLWVVLFRLPLFVIAVDSSARIGAINKGQGMLSIIRSHIHPSVAWLILAITLPVHALIAMGQFSVMTSAFLAMFGIYSPDLGNGSGSEHYALIERGVSLLLAIAILRLVLSRGYERMQKAMSLLMLAMFICFLVIAIRSFQQAGTILAGFIPSIPDALPVPGTDTFRYSYVSIIAIVGTAIAPGALLGMPYISSDARTGKLELRQELRKSIWNLGVVFGSYSIFIVLAGAFILNPSPNSAAIDSVHEAGAVLTGAFPGAVSFIGPMMFFMGLFIAALTTVVLVIQMIGYLSLDMLRKPWAFTNENKLFHRLVVVVTLAIGVLSPFWSFPELLKVILLIGVNILVVPLILAAMIYLLNRREVMGNYTAGIGRNLIMVVCFAVSLVLAVWNVLGYLS